MTQALHVAAAQFEHRPGDTQYNLARVPHFAGEAAAAGVRLLVCPEMCLLGYWHLRRRTAARLREMAEPADGPLVGAVRELATESGIGVGAGFLETTAAGCSTPTRYACRTGACTSTANCTHSSTRRSAVAIPARCSTPRGVCGWRP